MAVYDIGEFEGRPFIVMELVDGESLASRLQWRPFSVRDALKIGAQVAEALAAAHAAGVVHRDLKPQNIMLTPDGRAKIVDFGLGTLQCDNSANRPGDTRTRTMHFSVEGTAGYMAPEQAAGRPVDMRADQFALGVILYEMVSGWRAFVRETEEIQTLSDIIDAEPAPLKQVCPRASAALVAIVIRYCKGAARRSLRLDARPGARPASRRGGTIAIPRDDHAGGEAGEAGMGAAVCGRRGSACGIGDGGVVIYTSASVPAAVRANQVVLQAKLADAYSMLGRKADTLEAVAAVERLGSADAAALFHVASACERIGERALALQWLLKAVAAGYPRDSIAQSPALAELLSRSGM